jgi:hypothetical protein
VRLAFTGGFKNKEEDAAEDDDENGNAEIGAARDEGEYRPVPSIVVGAILVLPLS